MQVLLIVLISALTSIADSKGFVHASHVWSGSRFSFVEGLFSYLYYSIGIVSYFVLIFFMRKFGIKSVELQTAFWFILTITGVFFLNGSFLKWPVSEKIVMLMVVLGIVWLTLRLK